MIKFFQIRNRKKFIIYGLLIFFFFASLIFIVIPLKNKRDRLEALIPQKKRELKKVLKVRDEYLQYRAQTALIDEYLKKQGKNFEIMSFLEDVADKVNISSKITSMKPLESLNHNEVEAQVVFKGLSSDELRGYLYRIDTSEKFLWVKKMRLKRINFNNGALEASMNIVTLTSP